MAAPPLANTPGKRFSSGSAAQSKAAMPAECLNGAYIIYGLSRCVLVKILPWGDCTTTIKADPTGQPLLLYGYG